MLGWIKLQKAPFARVNHQAIFLSNDLYVFGGVSDCFLSMENVQQMEIFSWNIERNRWNKLPHPLPLLAFDCRTAQYSLPATVVAPERFPTHRFGHTVVPWRGRGWLFGGRDVSSLCSEQLYMFCPGSDTESGPSWSLVHGITGTPPAPRDGHSAVVHESAMFIFGGYVSSVDSFDNKVYRLDFHTWSWTHLQVFHPGRSMGPAAEEEESFQVECPLARDFACLFSHQGRLFLFGGRSQKNSPVSDVYDSALWELVPSETSDDVSCKCCSPDCSVLTKTHFRMAWEEQTGNWDSFEPWFTSPTRPPSLWRLLSSPPPDQTKHCCCCCTISPDFSSNSRWASGLVRWLRLHPGHGVQIPNKAITKLYRRSTISSPFGRRSASHWAYNGNLYVAFGVLSEASNYSSQLHFDDIWRFNLASCAWSRCQRTEPWPDGRRRASATLYWPRLIGCSQRPPVLLLFGGTQPEPMLEAKINVAPPLSPHEIRTELLALDQYSFERWCSPTIAPGLTPPSNLGPASPVVVCFVNPSNRCTQLSLVLVLPPTPRSQPILTPSCHLSIFSAFYVMSGAAISSWFCSPRQPKCSKEDEVLDQLLHSTPQTGIDAVRLYHILRTAWLSDRYIPDSRPQHAPPGHYCIRLVLTQANDTIVANALPEDQLRPIVLEHHSFSYSAGGVFQHQVSGTVDDVPEQPQPAQCRTNWLNVLDVLEECVRRSAAMPPHHHCCFTTTHFMAALCLDCGEPVTPPKEISVWCNMSSLFSTRRNSAAVGDSVNIVSALTSQIKQRLTGPLTYSDVPPHLPGPPRIIRLSSSTSFRRSSSFRLDQSSNSLEWPDIEPLVPIANTGVICRFKTSLRELSEVYLLHLDRTLYQLCLMRLHALHPPWSVMASLVPRNIREDYERICSLTSEGHERLQRALFS